MKFSEFRSLGLKTDIEIARFENHLSEREDYLVVETPGNPSLGAWYGAFLENRLVADAGLFHFGRIGRFQSVGTHPEFRRRGVASALTYNMAHRSLKRSKRLVLVADPENGADRVYRSVGFGGEEISVQLSHRAPRDQPPYLPKP